MRSRECGHQPCRQGTAKRAANGPGEHHDGHDTSDAVLAVPVRQVEDHSGGEARFKKTEQEANDVETQCVVATCEWPSSLEWRPRLSRARKP